MNLSRSARRVAGAVGLLTTFVPAVAHANGVWSELERVDVPNRAGVDISGTTAVFGAPTALEGAGAVLVFDHDGASLGTSTMLAPTDTSQASSVGQSLALEGDILVASGSDTYVFERVDGDWVERAVLPLTGSSVAVSGDTVVVGTTSSAMYPGGLASIFERNGDSWELSSEIGQGIDGALFGVSVAIDGDTLVVGAERYTESDVENAGAAFVYDRDGGNWTERLAFAPEVQGWVGISVSVSDDTVAIGAPLTAASEGGIESSGSVFVFANEDGTWQQQAILEPETAVEGGQFGRWVDLEGDRLAIGAPQRDGPDGVRQGGVFNATRDGSAWSVGDVALGSETGGLSEFGRQLALSGDFVVTHARLGGDTAGYLLRLQSASGTACEQAEQCLSGFCTDGVCCDTACGGGEPGDCEACSIAAGASEDGVCGPAAAGTVCREAAQACDVAETCDGDALACPDDESAADETPCDDGDQCTGDDVCQMGACVPGPDECGASSSSGDSDGGEAGNSDGSSTTDASTSVGESDSDSPTDSDGSTALDDDGGCSCTSGGDGGAPGAFMLGLALLGLRRRRVSTSSTV